MTPPLLRRTVRAALPQMLLAGLLVGAPSVARAATFVLQTPISGDPVPVTLEIVDVDGGVDIRVSVPPGEGDLLGLFASVIDESLVPQTSVDDPTGIVTQWQLQANKVWKVGGGNTMAPVKKWDFGVRFGDAGSAGGAVESAHFGLRAPGLEVGQLVGAANQGWVFGVRVQSTTGPEGSSKMGLPEGQPPDDEPPAGEGPTIAIEAPADGLLTAQTPIAVSGSVTGIPEPAVDVNGVVATVADGSFHASVPLLEGANTLAAAATNPSGSAHDAVSVTLDTTPPVVTITAPADGSRTTEAQTPVNGTVLDASPIASVTVNGVAATLDGGSFSATVPLTLGDNPITAVATDAVGNQGSDSVTTIRGSAPEVAITAPADGAELDVSPAIVMGTVAGTPPVAVVVNGVAVAVSEGSFTTSIPLQEGANTLTATASNDFGQASDAVAVSLVTAPELVVAIETPPDGATVSSSRIAVAGSVSEPEAAVSVNGVVATVSGTTWVAAAVKVSEGENLLTATATRGGASASDTSAVFLNLPPKIVITSPRDGAVLRDPDTDVEGFVDDVTAFVDVNGVNASVDSGGRFLAREVPLDPGTNVLTGRAVDPQGATGRDAVEVTRDDATAGRLRIVLVLDGASSGFETEPLIAEDGAEFAEALRAIGFAPERFEPAIEAPARGRVSFHLFVFAEAGVVGEPVAVPAISEVFFRLDDILPLLPMDQLEVEMEEASLDPSLRGALVPSDFEPNGFTRFGAEVVEVPQ